MSTPDDPWLGANPLDPAFRANPYPALAHLREVAPVHQTPIGVWRLTRYEDVARLLKDVPNGVRLANGELPGRGPDFPGGPGEFMLQKDPPDHTRLRKLVNLAFTPRAIAGLRERAREIAEQRLDAVLGAGRLDVIADLAQPVPSTMICEMMGVPLADRERFTEWTAHATHLLAAMMAPPAVLERGFVAAGQLATYFQDLIAERRRSLGSDILSDLIRAEEAGDRLSPTELVSQSIGLLIAGFETTIGLIGNGVLALARHPEQLARLRARPELVPSAVEECLRYDGPIALTVRVLRENTRFGDHEIPADSVIMALLASANRDPAYFPDPDRFDIERTRNDHLAFGGGIHFCLGAHLARMEAQAAIGALTARVARIELKSEELEWGQSLFRVLGSLRVRVTAA